MFARVNSAGMLLPKVPEWGMNGDDNSEPTPIDVDQAIAFLSPLGSGPSGMMPVPYPHEARAADEAAATRSADHVRGKSPADLKSGGGKSTKRRTSNSEERVDANLDEMSDGGSR